MSLWVIILGVVLVSFGISALCGKWLVPFLIKTGLYQPYKEEVAAQIDKPPTPTMGGFMFIFSTVLTTLGGYWVYRIQAGLDTTAVETRDAFIRLVSVLIFSLLFMVIGFIDDYTKVKRHHNDGLSAMQKIVLQVIFSLGFLFVLFKFGDGSTSINLGFWETPQLGIFYYIILIPVIIYLTNAVNLTDGVDGLCGSVTFSAMLIFTICCSILGENELSCFTMALAGGCLGFLIWNLHPAKCFMGDTGSMFLGAAVTGVSLILHNHLLMVLVSLVYIAEALSVVIQVGYFKYTKKKYGEGRRIFKMSPIHHHFQLCKWSENKIVLVFSGVCALFGVLGIVSLLAF